MKLENYAHSTRIIPQECPTFGNEILCLSPGNNRPTYVHRQNVYEASRSNNEYRHIELILSHPIREYDSQFILKKNMYSSDLFSKLMAAPLFD